MWKRNYCQTTPNLTNLNKIHVIESQTGFFQGFSYCWYGTYDNVQKLSVQRQL